MGRKSVLTKDQWSYIFSMLDAGIGGTRHFARMLEGRGIQISHGSIQRMYKKYLAEKDTFIEEIVDTGGDAELKREVPRYREISVSVGILAVLLMSKGLVEISPEVESMVRERAHEILKREGIDPLQFCREMGFLA